LTSVGKFGNITWMTETVRRISWLKGARRDFETFPPDARELVLDSLTVVAGGGMPGIAKPLKGLGSGVLELALRHRGGTYRVVYAVQLGADVWVVHAFEKKSKSGIKTPRAELDLVAERLKRLKEILR
jgi:phage-related protein